MTTAVGIDVSKKTCHIALRHQDGTYAEKVFCNDAKGAKKCISYLRTRDVSRETPLVLESTGGYHLLFAMTLRDTHFRGVKVINGILTKKYHKAKVRKTKTDSVDAKILADMGIMEKLVPFEETKEQFAQKQRITMLKKLEHVRQKLAGSIRDIEETASVLGLEVTRQEGSRHILKSIEKEIEQLNQKIVDHQYDPLVELLAEMPGVSMKNAAIISALMGNKIFGSRDQMVAFAGLDLNVRESGSSIHGKRRLSKRGDSFLRKKLFQTAWALMMNNSYYKAYYDKKRAEGHHYYTCLIAIARKFLYRIFALQKQVQSNNQKLV
ncbi:MAG: IS110 family transposase [Nitrospirota bacterium]